MDIISNLSQATPFMYPHFKIYIVNKTKQNNEIQFRPNFKFVNFGWSSWRDVSKSADSPLVWLPCSLGWGYPSTVCSSLFLFRVKLLDQRSICTRKIRSASMASVLLIKGKQKNKGWKSRKQLGVWVKQLLFKLDTVSGGGGVCLAAVP